MSLYFLLAFLPFVLFLFLLLWKKTSLLVASLSSFILTALLAIIFWQILPNYLLASVLKGILFAFDIFIIIFGAIFFLKILKNFNVVENLCYYLESFSKDYRVKIILLAWFLENFLEGTAGFGTPSTVVAPILISLGLSPLKAVAISLLGNSASVAFGAAGTPIRVGFAGLAISSVPKYTALFNFVGLLVPVFMLFAIVREKVGWKKQFLEGLPFALWAGIAFVIPSYLFVFLGQEFPSILGAVAGLFLVLLTTKLDIFVPKNTENFESALLKEKLPLFRVIFPYGLLILLLIFGKIFIGSAGLVLNFGIKHTFALFNPGFAFIISGLLVTFLWKKEKTSVFKAAKDSFMGAVEPFLVIAAMSGMVQLMINCGQNTNHLLSMMEIIAKSFEVKSLPFWAPVIGGFGSFLTGSATVSNVMFGSFLNTASQALKMDSGKILALQLVGAAAGNMIALADMLAAQAVVGLKNKERAVLKEVIVPCLIYIVLVGLAGMLFV